MTDGRGSDRASRNASRRDASSLTRHARAPNAVPTPARSRARYSPSRWPRVAARGGRNSLPKAVPTRNSCRRRMTWKPWLSAITTVILRPSWRAVTSRLGSSGRCRRRRTRSPRPRAAASRAPIAAGISWPMHEYPNSRCALRPPVASHCLSRSPTGRPAAATMMSPRLCALPQHADQLTLGHQSRRRARRAGRSWPDQCLAPAAGRPPRSQGPGGGPPGAPAAVRATRASRASATIAQGTQLGRVVRGHVDAHEPNVWLLEQAPGRRDEVRQARADADDQVRVAQHGVGGRVAFDADATHAQVGCLQQGALAGECLGDRDAERVRELAPARPIASE